MLRTQFFLTLCLILTSSVSGWGQKPDADGIRFFETKIRPLFVDHCYKCHGKDKQESDLRLDSYTEMMKGGAAGDAIVPGDPDSSLVIVAVRYLDEDLQMPPDTKLDERQIADLAKWIELGAPHPDAKGNHRPAPPDAQDQSEHWSFQPLRAPQLPPVKHAAWPRTSVDYFVLSRFEQQGLTPVPDAAPATLLRRMSYDLLGLPPTPEEMAVFLADEMPGALARAVERLLSSPHYGERWGRHWLDVARYADSNGLDENIAHGNAWRYRDYVVDALNADRPFDQFVREQLAGDLLAANQREERYKNLIATGFLTLGPKVLAEGDEMKMEMDIIDEQIDTIGRSFLGLTLGCARCHDHKFDPISTEDYYALAGIFKSTRTMESLKRIARWNEVEIPCEEELAAKASHDEQLAAHKARIADRIEEARKGLDPPPAEGESEDAAALEKRFSEEVQAELAELRKQLKELESAAPTLPTAMSVAEGTVTDLKVHIRGSHLNLGRLVRRRVPLVLARFSDPEFGEAGSGRLELANWIASPEHPLTSRVLVNRVWRWHFGRGLVASTDNFGVQGEAATNPPLLDYLATRFTAEGWSLKDLHREILLSRTYQLSSRSHPENETLDPGNLYFWRANLRRLEAEVIRDAILAVSGKLDTAMGGSLLHVENRKFLFDHTSKDETSYDSRKRSIYLPVIRNHLYDMFSLFDYTDASVSNGNRSESTIAPQALFLLNSDLVVDASRALADRVLREAEQESANRIQRLYRLALSRPPTASEVELAHGAVDQFKARIGDGEGASDSEIWTALAQVVLLANEFIVVR